MDLSLIEFLMLVLVVGGIALSLYRPTRDISQHLIKTLKPEEANARKFRMMIGTGHSEEFMDAIEANFSILKKCWHAGGLRSDFYHPNDPASQDQLDLLQRKGVATENISQLTIARASDLIGLVLPVSEDHYVRLEYLGIDPESMNEFEATVVCQKLNHDFKEYQQFCFHLRSSGKDQSESMKLYDTYDYDHYNIRMMEFFGVEYKGLTGREADTRLNDVVQKLSNDDISYWKKYQEMDQQLNRKVKSDETARKTVSRKQYDLIFRNLKSGNFPPDKITADVLYMIFRGSSIKQVMKELCI